ncbi:MAG: hypothetical protein ACXVBE_17910, partial [Bdellovibrionota bacterium]
MAAVLFLFLSLPKFNRDVEIPAVFVELPATNSTSAATTAPARHGGKIGSVLSAGGAKSIPFSALAPAWKPGMAAKAGAVTPSDDSEESWDMQKSGDIIAPKSSGAVVWVYKKTENVLGYPSVFTRNAI